MKIGYFTASAFALVAGGSAQAADIVRPDVNTAIVAAPPTFSWNGFYAGGNAGASLGRSKIGLDDGGEVKSMNPYGFIGGLYAGYNIDVGGDVILGLDTDFLWSNLRKYNNVDRLNQKWTGSTRLRVGYAVNRWFPYVAAGVSYSKIDALFDQDGDSVKNKIHAGWTAGTGYDYAMTDNVLLRAEYRYSDLGEKTYNISDKNAHVKFNSNDFRIGIAYKF